MAAAQEDRADDVLGAPVVGTLEVLPATQHVTPPDALRTAVGLVLGAVGLALVAVRAVVDGATQPPSAFAAAAGGPRTARSRSALRARLTVTSAVGLAVAAQRRSLDVAATVAAPVTTVVSSVAGVVEAVASLPPLAAVGRRLGDWSEQGLAEQRRSQELTLVTGQAVVRAVVDAVLAEVDLDRIVERVDLDRAVARVDLDRVVDRLDLDRVVERLDLDAVASRLDLDAVAARLDVNAVVDRVDFTAVTNRVLELVDVDAVAARLDLDAVVARIDVNAIVDRVDLAHVTEQVLDEVDVAHIMRESSGLMAAESVDSIRVQSMRADRFLSRLADRVLLRSGGRDTSPPHGSVDPSPLGQP